METLFNALRVSDCKLFETNLKRTILISENNAEKRARSQPMYLVKRQKRLSRQ